MKFSFYRLAISLSLIALIENLAACSGNQNFGQSLLSSASGNNGSGLSNGGGGGKPVPTLPPNAKVFYKNPNFVAQRAVAYTATQGNSGLYTLSPSTPINFDQYLSDVRITDTQNNSLQNNDIRVRTDYGGTKFTPATPDANGFWNFSSIGDTNMRLSQLMAYHWINTERNTAENLIAQSWHPTNKNVQVYSLCYDVNDQQSQVNNGYNAFWAGASSNYVCMSYLGPWSSAYDASVYIHEMGHANIDYGTNGQIGVGDSNTTMCQTSSGQQFECCASADGCSAAMNEGQADVHSLIVFNSGIVGEFFMNNMSGLPGRNAELNGSLTAQGMYNGTAVEPVSQRAYGVVGKEIHYMGGVWGAAWWTLRKSVGNDVSDKIFFAHLELLTGADTFRTALSTIIRADQALVSKGVFTSNHQSQIQAAFAQHGINP